MSKNRMISALERRNAWEHEVTAVDDVNFSGSMNDTVPSVLPLSPREPSPTTVPTVTEAWATAPNGPKHNKRGSIVVPKEARRSISNQFAHLRANQGIVASNRGSITNGMASPRLATANRKVEGSDEPEGFKHEDAFEYEGLDVREWESLPYVPPSIDKATSNHFQQIYENGQASFWGTSLRDLNSLGVGVSLHFRILVYLGVFFLFATVLALPIFYFAFTGQRNPVDEMDPARFAILSVGNISPNAALANGTIPTPGLFSSGISTRTLSLVITAYDFVLALSFILFFIYLRWRIYSIAQKVDRILVTAGDYSVYVTGLPRDVTEDEVREHFNDRYDLYRGDWVFPSNFWHCYLGRKMFMRRKMTTDALLNLSANDGVLEAIDGLDSKNASVTPSNGGMEKKQKGQDALRRRLYDEDVYPVLDATNTGKAEYLNQWVAEVTLTRSNGRVIMAYQSQLKLIQRIRSARAAVKKYSEYTEWANEEKRVKALEQLAKLETRFDAVHKVARKLYDNSVVGAFVVFQNEESTRRCLEDYHGSNSWFNFNGYWGQPPHLRFRRESRLTVVEAPEPHQVIWENLQLTWRERIVRQMGVNSVVAIILFVSFLVIITAKAQQNDLLGYSPPAKLCNVVFPSIAFNVPFTSAGKVETGFSLPDSYTLNVMSNINGTCPRGQSRLYFTADDGRPTQTSVRNPHPCLNECIDTKQTCTWPTSSGSNITISTLMWQNCYCSAKAASSFRTGNIFQVWFDAQNTDGGWCQEFVRNYVIYNIFVVFAASSVLIINMMLRSVLASSSKWEGYWTTQDMQRASTIKVFVSMVVNTAGMVLLINAALPNPANTWSFGSFPLFNGKYTDFDSLWHANVGSSIVLTMCINIVSPHWYNVYYLVCKRAFCRFSRVNRETTQQQLNKRFEPVEFEVPTRTAVTLNTLWCCFMYASGQPLLLLVACVSFLFSFWIDKLTILRIASKPPMYDESVAMLFTQCIPIIVLIHLLIAIWTYSDASVIYSQGAFLTAREVSTSNDVLGKLNNWLPTSTADSSGLNVLDRVTRENTAPLAMLLIFLFVIWFLYAFFRDFIARGLAFFCFIASRGRFCTTYGLQGAGAERFSGFQNNPAFTGPYKLAAKAPTAARNSVMLIDHRRVRSYTAYDVRGRLFRIYRWVSDGVAYGLPHVAGQRLLTWQVIAEMGMIPSYRIAANPLYAPAVAAMALGRRQVALELKVAQGKGPLIPKMKRSSQITSSAIAMAASADGEDGGDPEQSALDAAADAEYGINSRNSLDERALFRAAAGGSISKAMAEAMRDVEELGFAGNAGAVIPNRAPEALKVTAEVALSEATRKAKERIGNGISPFKSIRSPALQHIASTRDMWQANAVARVPPPPPRPAANTGIAAFKSVRASMQWVSGAVPKAMVAPPPPPLPPTTGGQITVDAGVLVNPMAGLTERGEEEGEEDDDATPRGDDTPTAAAASPPTKPAPTPSPPASTVSEGPAVVVVASEGLVTPPTTSPPKKPLPVSIPKLDLSRGAYADHVAITLNEGEGGSTSKAKENSGPITTAGDPVALNSLGSITSTSVFTPLKGPGGKLPSWRHSGSRGDSRGDTDTEEPPSKEASTARKMASSHSLTRMDATAGKDGGHSDSSDEGVSRMKSKQPRSSLPDTPPTPPLRQDSHFIVNSSSYPSTNDSSPPKTLPATMSRAMLRAQIRDLVKTARPSEKQTSPSPASTSPELLLKEDTRNKMHNTHSSTASMQSVQGVLNTYGSTASMQSMASSKRPVRSVSSRISRPLRISTDIPSPSGQKLMSTGAESEMSGAVSVLPSSPEADIVHPKRKRDSQEDHQPPVVIVNSAATARRAEAVQVGAGSGLKLDGRRINPEDAMPRGFRLPEEHAHIAGARDDLNVSHTMTSGTREREKSKRRSNESTGGEDRYRDSRRYRSDTGASVSQASSHDLMAASRSGVTHARDYRASQASTEILHNADSTSFSRHGSRSTSRRPDGSSIRGDDRREERREERKDGRREEERRGEGRGGYNRRSTDDLGSEGITPSTIRYTEGSRDPGRSTSRPAESRRDDGRREERRGEERRGDDRRYREDEARREEERRLADEKRREEKRREEKEREREARRAEEKREEERRLEEERRRIADKLRETRREDDRRDERRRAEAREEERRGEERRGEKRTEGRSTSRRPEETDRRRTDVPASTERGHDRSRASGMGDTERRSERRGEERRGEEKHRSDRREPSTARSTRR